MHSHFVQRLRKSSTSEKASSLSAVPPPEASAEHSTFLAELAARVLYRSPLPSRDDLPIFILNAAALPDAKEVEYDNLLPYVLARLPREDELINGRGYEVIFFAGGSDEGATASKKARPGWAWFVQAYKVLTRAMRKRMQKLYIVHTKTWVRILVEMFSTVVSPKSRRKIIYCSTLTGLALHMPIEDLLIPPIVYLHDRRLSPDIHAPYATGRRAFGARQPFPVSGDGTWRLPRVLRETSCFLLRERNLRTEGIFRIPPLARHVEVLCEAYDRGQKFILWKEGDTTLVSPRHNRLASQVLDEELTWQDGYSVFAAAGLIKNWYARLREPVFPHSTYQDLTRVFGSKREPVDERALQEVLSLQSRWSVLPLSSRLVLLNHLLPLLHRVVAHQEQNKMTAVNLAVCFAPALTCGPDALEDARMGDVIRRILEAAILHWPDLLQACDIGKDDFDRALGEPLDIEHYEDPLDEQSTGQASKEPWPDSTLRQVGGIALIDAEAVTESSGPPLPPRPRSSSQDELSDADPGIRRKPAPSAAIPPRYSMAIAERVVGIVGAGSPNEDAMNRTMSPEEHNGGFISPDDESEGSRARSRSDVPARKPLTNPPSLSQSSRTHADAPRNVHGSGAFQQHHNIDAVREASDSRRSAGALASVATQKADALSSREDNSGNVYDGFVKPTWPASARSTSNPMSTQAPVQMQGRSLSGSREPLILSLARPVEPVPSPAASPQMTLPSPTFAKPRAPSPGLTNRFPLPAPLHRSQTDLGPRGRAPRRLNLGSESIEDLKRLYEERAGTANNLATAAAALPKRSATKH
ncbi:MAG: hypothetical protein M1817_003931 [Caeruleum heppii]|nr:MAG: hypothetical protein M1817_003931 [Caeruleum heppii]